LLRKLWNTAEKVRAYRQKQKFGVTNFNRKGLHADVKIDKAKYIN